MVSRSGHPICDPGEATNTPPKPLSTHFFIGPGRYDIDDLSSYVMTYPAPNNAPSFMWYTGEMWTEGSLVRNKMHAHSNSFHRAFFVAGTPQQLGLDRPQFRLQPMFQPLLISDTGYDKDEDLIDALLARAKDQRLPVVCSSQAQSEMVAGVLYDRAPLTSCSPWQFKKGEVFTVLTFARPAEKKEGTSPAHTHWFMWYDDHLSQNSRYSYGVYSQCGPGSRSRSPVAADFVCRSTEQVRDDSGNTPARPKLVQETKPVEPVPEEMQVQESEEGARQDCSTTLVVVVTTFVNTAIALVCYHFGGWALRRGECIAPHDDRVVAYQGIRGQPAPVDNLEAPTNPSENDLMGSCLTSCRWRAGL